MGPTDSKRRLADAVRLLLERVLLAEAPEEMLLHQATQVEAIASELAPFSGSPFPGSSLRELLSSSPGGFGAVAQEDIRVFYSKGCIYGAHNALAAPIELSFEGEKAIGRGTFGVPYQGPPGCVHGGIVAAVFDQILGSVNIFRNEPGMTGTLTVYYRRPTPLYRELRFEAWRERKEGRKMFARGAVYDGDTLTAEAEGVFIAFESEAALDRLPGLRDWIGRNGFE
jgi:acyl-coenzyme A thioesterase PaaI-like protein